MPLIIGTDTPMLTADAADTLMSEGRADTLREALRRCRQR